MTVIRRRGQVWFAGLVLAIGVPFVVERAHRSSGPYELSAHAFLSLALTTVGWLVWQVGVHARIVVASAGVTVVNWVCRYEIPWSMVEHVPGGDGLRIVLADGREVRPAVGAHGVLGDVWGNRLQERMRRAILDGLRTGRREPADVAWRLDLNLRGYAAAVATILAVELL
ncbi:MAG TPA: PH domain-containing protein [Pseudonocardiaceae bacterium]